MSLEDLITIAKVARKNAYSPYSNFQVGAALLCKDGKVYSGCNIENGGIQAICAERVAFSKAISDGQKDFSCIVVVGGHSDEDLTFTTPCGYCRQFMSEFVDSDFKIHLFYDSMENLKTYSIQDLLPGSFKL